MSDRFKPQYVVDSTFVDESSGQCRGQWHSSYLLISTSAYNCFLQQEHIYVSVETAPTTERKYLCIDEYGLSLVSSTAAQTEQQLSFVTGFLQQWCTSSIHHAEANCDNGILEMQIVY